MEYIFEKSSADLALVHHDDLSTLLGAMTSTGVEDALCQLAPMIFVENGVGMLDSTFKAYQDMTPTNSTTSMSPPVVFPEQAPLPGNASVTSHEQRAHEEERSLLSTSFLEVNVAQLCNDTAQARLLLQLTSAALTRCQRYESFAKDVSRQMKRLSDQLSGLLEVLEDVCQLVDHEETRESPRLSALTGLLNNPFGRSWKPSKIKCLPCCLAELESLGTVLEIEPGRNGHIQALTWPLKEADVNTTVDKLAKFQDLLATALDVDQTCSSVEVLVDQHTESSRSVQQARSHIPSVPPRPTRAPSGDITCTFRCKLCDERFDRKSGLDIHTQSRSHEDKRAHACSQPGCLHNTIRVWNADAGEVISAPFEGHTDTVSSVAFSHDGKRIVSGSDDNTIRVWNADTGELISAPFEGHTDTVLSVAFSHDGKRIVSGSDDQTIRVWNTDIGEVISAPFEGHTNWVRSVAFSHDGKRIVSGSDDNKIRVWNADTGELISAPFEGHTDTVLSVAFSHDGKRIVSGSDDNTIRVWNADTGELISAPLEGHTDTVLSVAFSHDGKRIVSGSDDNTIRVWNADTGELISAPFEGHTDTISSVAFSHDDKRIVSGSDDNTIRVWNAATGELISAPFEGHTDTVSSVAFSHDGKRIVSGSDDNTIRVWNAATGELISAPFEGHTDTVLSVAFSHDGKRIVSGSDDNTIRVWNADTGELISAPFEGHTDTISSVAFSHDGKRIVSGSDDSTIRVECRHRGAHFSTIRRPHRRRLIGRVLARRQAHRLRV
ncbi:quinon protein alcohol dehydrogenase-like superfamily [Gautieria morchelliformis]|nr:quinon protein alcohol dehydrogenase-like superfamily [Gautieria morchelliformis]